MLKGPAARALILLLAFLASFGAVAEDPRLLVVYPKARAPFDAAYQQLISGMKGRWSGSVRALEIRPEQSDAVLARWLSGTRTEQSAVALLGTRALRLYRKTDQDLPAVVGVTPTIPRGPPMPGISLSLAPDIYLQRLRDLLPDINEVFLIHSARDPWYAEIAVAAGEQMGIRIIPEAIESEIPMLRITGQTLARIDPGKQAIWFTQGTISINTEEIFPLVLERAWDRRIAVFSDTLAYTKSGFVFALYPDFEGLGGEIADLASQRLMNTELAFRPARSARLALNTRMAARLGISLRTQRSVSPDLRFPAK